MSGTLMLLLGLVAGLACLFWLVKRPRTRKHGLERPTIEASWVRARLKTLAEPSLLLVPTETPKFSKLGGDPELPATISWPVDNGRSRSFLAQIDFAEAQASGGATWLPPDGRLFVFYDPEKHGEFDVVTAIYSSDPSGKSLMAPSRTKHRFAEQRVEFKRVISAPSSGWLGVEHHIVHDDDPDGWEEIANLVTAPIDDEMQHRIGGYPNEIQDAQMALTCERAFRKLPDLVYERDVTPELQQAADEWRLLIQIDSDPSLKMNWGDGGRLYAFIRKSDAHARDFTKTVGIWQTY